MQSAKRNYLGEKYWDDKKIALLGTMSDEALAKHLGINWVQVYLKRSSLGIASFRKYRSIEWCHETILLLGKKSDQAVAKILGIATTTVIQKRHSLGIASFLEQSNSRHLWSEEELAMLGKSTDKEVAQRLNIAAHCVMDKRRSLGIKAFTSQTKSTKPRANGVPWTRKNLALLGKFPDQRVAEMLDINRKTVLKKRKELGIVSYAVGANRWHQWKEEEIEKLGKFIDRELANQMGVNPTCVTAKRRQLGIASYKAMSGTHNPRVWSPQELKTLGKMTDEELALKLGISKEDARKKRNEMDINTTFSAKLSAD
jgi:DNA-binding CsgD family transcriptional regulator